MFVCMHTGNKKKKKHRISKLTNLKAISLTSATRSAPRVKAIGQI